MLVPSRYEKLAVVWSASVTRSLSSARIVGPKPLTSWSPVAVAYASRRLSKVRTPALRLLVRTPPS